MGAEEKFSPQKIVCLSPSGAEILCALNSFDKIKARTDYCDYPEELKSLPSVGGFDGKTLSIETILAYSPDFVYGSQGMHDFLKKPLEKLGIKVFLSNAANGISQTKQEILYIANLLEKQAEGKKIIEHIEQQINSVPKSAPTKTVYYEVWNEPFITSGKSSFINELLEAAGYKNVFDSIKESYPMVSEESIIASQPQIIILPDANGIKPQNIKMRRGWNKIPAVKNNAIFTINADLISRPGPRIGEAVLALSKLTN
ncbi:helical backbone metal receptor [uncultured Treponema sp.]|uniref:ABC transporter substrate-binding protein n=1 Tax=uncultured Treponema sp. TaxID=162155 RepID=UPI0025DA8C3C|nr:helical backbone metal receptor [uncultured Treponema sp.]